MEDLNLDTQMSWYNEEMFERRANGIETCSFKEWKRRRDAINAYFMSIDVKQHHQRIIDSERGK